MADAIEFPFGLRARPRIALILPRDRRKRKQWICKLRAYGLPVEGIGNSPASAYERWMEQLIAIKRMRDMDIKNG